MPKAPKASKSPATKAAGARAPAARSSAAGRKDAAVSTLFSTLTQRRQEVVKVVPTGSLSLDLATVVGGFPRGRITEVFGPESGGKSTLALQAAAMAHEADPKAHVFYLDLESSFLESYAIGLGIDPSRLHLCQPDFGEEGLTALEEAMSKVKGLVMAIVDSLPALVPKAYFDKDYDDEVYAGDQAKLQSQAMRRLVPLARRTQVAVVLINQIREAQGGKKSWGGPQFETPGARAVRFFSSLRLDVQPGEKIADKAWAKGVQREFLGVHARVRVVKNKLGPPFREAKYPMRFGRGVDRPAELALMAVDLGVVRLVGKGTAEAKGAWLDDDKIADSEKGLVKLLAGSNKVSDTLEGLVREAYQARVDAANEPPPSEDEPFDDEEGDEE